MMEIRTGNDVIGWVIWQVEIPEATRWEILRRDIAAVHADPLGGIEITVDVTAVVELLEKHECLQADGDVSIRALPHVHLRDLAGQIAWWLHTGLDPKELPAAAEGPPPQPPSVPEGGGTAQRPFEPAGTA